MLLRGLSTDFSHLVSVPPGPHLLAEVIQQSPVLYDPERAAPAGGDDGMGDFDASEDPELAMALRMSLQEAQEREERERGTGGETSTATATEIGVVPQDVEHAAVERRGLVESETAPLSNANDPGNTAPGDDGEDEDDEDEDAMLARAMALSRGEGGDGDVEMEDEDDEDAAIARAIAMSLEEDKKDDKESK